MSRWNQETWKERLLKFRSIDELSGCWLWTGAKMRNGYGVIGVKAGGRKGNRLVHRLAAHVFLGFDLMSTTLILHRCDVRHCFNPEHLFQGTHQDNMQDMWSKGRAPNQHHPRKLTVDSVVAIRRIYAAGGETTRSLAAKWNLGKSTIEAIVNRRIWRHVGD